MHQYRCQHALKRPAGIRHQTVRHWHGLMQTQHLLNPNKMPPFPILHERSLQAHWWRCERRSTGAFSDTFSIIHSTFFCRCLWGCSITRNSLGPNRKRIVFLPLVYGATALVCLLHIHQFHSFIHSFLNATTAHGIGVVQLCNKLSISQKTKKDQRPWGA